MAKSLMQIRSSIENQLRGGYQVDDDRFDEDLIHDMIHDSRNVLLEWYYKTYRYFNDLMYQDICCLQIYCHEITCTVDGRVMSSGVSQYRVDLPDLFELGGQIFIRFLGTVDFGIPATRRSLMGSIYSEAYLHTADALSYTIHNAGGESPYAVLENLPTDGMKFICISAIPQNPMDLKCIRLTEEEDYPIPDILVAKLEMMIIERLMKPMLLVDPNQPNNAIDDGKVYNSGKQRSRNQRNQSETLPS